MWDQEVYLDKSEVMIIRKGTGRNRDSERLMLDDSEVRVTGSYGWVECVFEKQSE